MTAAQEQVKLSHKVKSQRLGFPIQKDRTSRKFFWLASCFLLSPEKIKIDILVFTFICFKEHVTSFLFNY